MAKVGSEASTLISEFRQEKKTAKIFKRFQDEFYALDLLRVRLASFF